MPRERHEGRSHDSDSTVPDTGKNQTRHATDGGRAGPRPGAERRSRTQAPVAGAGGAGHGGFCRHLGCLHRQRGPALDRPGLHLSQGGLSWVVNAYVLAFGGFLLLGGRMADLLGRRRVFIISLAVFSLASLAGGLAPDGTLLVAARAVQGLAAAAARARRLVAGHRHVRGRTRVTGRWGSGERWPAVPRPASCSAACSPPAWAGGGSCSSTCPSASRARWPRPG